MRRGEDSNDAVIPCRHPGVLGETDHRSIIDANLHDSDPRPRFAPERPIAWRTSLWQRVATSAVREGVRECVGLVRPRTCASRQPQGRGRRRHQPDDLRVRHLTSPSRRPRSILRVTSDAHHLASWAEQKRSFAGSSACFPSSAAPILPRDPNERVSGDERRSRQSRSRRRSLALANRSSTRGVSCTS